MAPNSFPEVYPVYNLIISSLLGLAVFGALLPIREMHWAFALFIGIVVSFIAMIISTRKVMKKLEPMFNQAQKQAQARQFKLAIQTLENILPFSKWQLMLKAQVSSQMGVFYFADKKEDKAIEYLKNGSVRSPESQLILASIYFRKGDLDAAKEVMDITIKFNKKNPLLYNTLAFMLQVKKRNDEALAILQKGLKALGGHDATQDNLTRLQNEKKMNMKPFGMNWYSLQLEKPPLSMMQDQFSGRAGFRQPKRKKG
jgi:tetratricopeptide (TPR) repeat protein